MEKDKVFRLLVLILMTQAISVFAELPASYHRTFNLLKRTDHIGACQIQATLNETRQYLEIELVVDTDDDIFRGAMRVSPIYEGQPGNISVKRTGGPNYQVVIEQPETGDSGNYHSWARISLDVAPSGKIMRVEWQKWLATRLEIVRLGNKSFGSGPFGYIRVPESGPESRVVPEYGPWFSVEQKTFEN